MQTVEEMLATPNEFFLLILGISAIFGALWFYVALRGLAGDQRSGLVTAGYAASAISAVVSIFYIGWGLFS